uniref:Xylulose kinase-1 n=1 Tax=Tanacetum cinerariifolium TaxID=118510 RepID=A0A699GLV4_TANCI|nr:hypothetical protein [Tanacetum cinerariifolium]
MTLTFADTHNMIAYLTKSDASERFNQIIDFLNGSSIKYTLTVNPHIYVSCIKQFWTSVAVKKVNDVTRLQALVDKKNVIITEDTVRDALRLADVEGIECLPNEDIFIELARMGAQVGNLSSDTTTYSSPALTQKVFANMKRVGKGFFGAVTPLFEGMLVAQEVGEGAPDEVHVEDVPAVGVAAEGAASVADDDVPAADKITQALEITKLKQRVKKLERRNKGRMIADVDADVDVTLKDIDNDVALDAEIKESADVRGGKQNPKLKSIKLTLHMLISATITVAALQLTTTAALTLTTTPSAARRRKGVVIRDPEETTTPSTIIHCEAKSKDKGKGILDEVIDHVHRKAKEDNVVKRYQALKRKPQTKAQARKNMMIYLRNVAGFKMDYFKGMTYDDICPIFEKKFNSNVAFLQKTKVQMDEEDSRALKRINESQEDKVEKRQKLDEEVKELRRHLQIVPNDEDDIYTKATPLALKVPVVDYEIYNEQNKPYYKTKRADDHYIHYNTVDFAGREEISTYKVHSGSYAQQSEDFEEKVLKD